MAGSSLLTLLDDIATLLDDISVMGKIAAKKTAGVLGDDLSLNAQQVSGVRANRELPVVWGVAKGSFINKVILVPLALLISAFIPWAITPLLMIGGAFLCYEGVEKVLHTFESRKEKESPQARQARLEALAATCEGVDHPVTLPWREGKLDLATFWRQWLSWQAGPAQKAWAFHDALARGLAAMMRDCANARNIHTLAFGGGVLHNRLLTARLTFYLADFTLLFAQQLPAGDGAIAYGQAMIAAARGQAQGTQQ